MHDLQGDATIESKVLGQIDSSHPALAQLPYDLVSISEYATSKVIRREAASRFVTGRPIER
jgi:hypothetical protein